MTHQNLADLEGSRAWQKRRVREYIPAAIQDYRHRNRLDDTDPVTVNAPRFVLDALAGTDGLGCIDLLCHDGETGIYLYASGSLVHKEGGMLDLGEVLGWRWRLRKVLPRRWVR